MLSIGTIFRRCAPGTLVPQQLGIYVLMVSIFLLNTIFLNSSSEKQATGPGYKKIRLIRSLKKFIFRYQDLVEIYSVSAEKIINDGFSNSENV